MDAVSFLIFPGVALQGNSELDIRLHHRLQEPLRFPAGIYPMITVSSGDNGLHSTIVLGGKKIFLKALPLN